ncbi:conserved domain protein [Ruminococcus albus 8]|uniref:Conserved domain protein n=1 Tax=Ruminococcus albus 8 TaxID=246199 RepID=E9SCG9_RUMAL|nr:conserved domain protein [Ruminococcus albus 8]
MLHLRENISQISQDKDICQRRQGTDRRVYKSCHDTAPFSGAIYDNIL